MKNQISRARLTQTLNADPFADVSSEVIKELLRRNAVYSESLSLLENISSLSNKGFEVRRVCDAENDPRTLHYVLVDDTSKDEIKWELTSFE